MRKWDYNLTYAVDQEGKAEEIPADLYKDRKFVSSKKPIHPVKLPEALQGLAIDVSQLDARGDIDFDQDEPADLRIRGGLEYYKPTHGKGYGIDIGDHVNKFQKWAVCFHGVRSVDSIPKILKEGLKAGPGQSYANQKDVCGDLVVPVGIYASPWIK